MNSFFRKGANAQRKYTGGSKRLALLRLCGRTLLSSIPSMVQQNSAALVNKHPDRFLFGTDEVAPLDQEKYLRVYRQYEPFWKLLTPEASEKVRKENYEQLFDEARRKVRRWEQTHSKGGSGNTGVMQ